MAALFKPNVEKLKAKKDIKGLVKGLSYKDITIRREAAEAFGVELLIQILMENDYDHLAKAQVALALGYMNDRKAVEPLIQTLMESDLIIQTKAAWALGEIGDERTVEPLIQALKASFMFSRMAAAQALGEIGDERAVEPLVHALKDEVHQVRYAALEALAKLGWNPRNDTEVISGFIAAKPWDELPKFGVQVIEPLIQVLKGGGLDDLFGTTDNDIQRISDALATIGTPAVEPLIHALKKDEYINWGVSR
jgi:HEAT repeat protein